MAVLTKAKVESDLIRWEANPEFTRVEAVVRNPDASAVELTDPIGYPLVLTAGVLNLAVAGDEGYIVALLIPTAPMPSIAATTTTTQKFAVLRNGPAIIDKAMIPTTDLNGDAFNLDDIVESLALIDIKAFAEPPKISQQTA